MRRSAVVLILSAAIVLVGCSKDDGPPTAPAPRSAAADPGDRTQRCIAPGAGRPERPGHAGGAPRARAAIGLLSVTLDSIRSLHTSLTWTGAQDLEVGVTDVNGIMVRNTDTPTGNPEACTVVALPPGTYRVRVGSRSTSAVSYLLTIGRR
jgi:hypothetical protein